MSERERASERTRERENERANERERTSERTRERVRMRERAREKKFLAKGKKNLTFSGLKKTSEGNTSWLFSAKIKFHKWTMRLIKRSTRMSSLLFDFPRQG